MLTIIVRSVFEEDGKYYPQLFLDECLYEVISIMHNNPCINDKTRIL